MHSRVSKLAERGAKRGRPVNLDRRTIEWFTIEEIVAWHEADPKRAAVLRDARKRLAPYLYSPDDPRYERMMRGEGPNDETTP